MGTSDDIKDQADRDIKQAEAAMRAYQENLPKTCVHEVPQDQHCVKCHDAGLCDVGGADAVFMAAMAETQTGKAIMEMARDVWKAAGGSLEPGCSVYGEQKPGQALRHECPVYGCTGAIDKLGLGWFCGDCWMTLPGLARKSIAECFEEAKRGRTSRRGELLLEQAMQRLCAEGRGRAEALTEDEQDDAFTLAYQAMSVGVPGLRFVGVGCYEWDDVLQRQLDVSDGKGGGFGADRRVCEALANYYDRAQARRGDPRRAIRLGYGGL